MIITTDTGRWYEKLMEEHEKRASDAPPNSGTRKAEDTIAEELKQMYRDRTLRFTIRQAMVLLCARIRFRVHTLTEQSTFNAEKREVYYRFLASYSKINHETPLSIFRAVQEYIYNGCCTSPIQAYCLGLFVQYAVHGDNYTAVHPLASVHYMREWLLKQIDYYETLNTDYYIRQEAINAFIYILGIFH